MSVSVAFWTDAAVRRRMLGTEKAATFVPGCACVGRRGSPETGDPRRRGRRRLGRRAQRMARFYKWPVIPGNGRSGGRMSRRMGEIALQRLQEFVEQRDIERL